MFITDSMLKQKFKPANSTYNNFVIAHEKASKECIPLKPKLIKRVPWESTKIEEKRSIRKKKSSNKDNNPSQNNILEINQTLCELKDVYELEQTVHTE